MQDYSNQDFPQNTVIKGSKVNGYKKSKQVVGWHFNYREIKTLWWTMDLSKAQPKG